MLLFNDEITQNEIFRLLSRHFTDIENLDNFISLGDNWPFLPLCYCKVTLFKIDKIIELIYGAGFIVGDREEAKVRRDEMVSILKSEYPSVEFYFDGIEEMFSAVMFSARHRIPLGSAITSNKIISETKSFYNTCVEAKNKYVVPEQQRISPYNEEQLDYIRRAFPSKTMQSKVTVSDMAL